MILKVTRHTFEIENHVPGAGYSAARARIEGLQLKLEC